MHADHQRDASFAERLVDRVTAVVGRPASFVLVAIVIVFWVISAFLFGNEWPDKYPFPALNLIISGSAICIAILILSSQRRADRLAQKRQQLALEVALLAEHKTSKIIDLIEELRRDLPGVHNRVDLEAIEMTSKSDHEAVLDIIEERASEQIKDEGGDGLHLPSIK